VISEKDSQTLRALDEWEEKEGRLPLSLNLYRQLLRIQSESRAWIPLPIVQLEKENVANRLREGQPLLDFEGLPIDWHIFQGIFKQAQSVYSHYPELTVTLDNSLQEIDTQKAAAEAWYRGNSLEKYGGNSVLLSLLIQTALKPFLNASVEALSPFVDQEIWRKPYCPFCGGSPDFSFLDKERGARHLMCSRCDADWLFQRMECPDCGNRDQDSLAFFSNDSGLYRLYVCDKCKSYIKAIDLRCTEDPVLLLLERFNTLDLDAQACRDGYHNKS
jgi:FdhE protein